MTIFEDLKQALQSDLSWDLKLGIENDHFDVVLETRVDDGYRSNSEFRKFCCGHDEPTLMIVRYDVVSERSYLSLNDMSDGEVLSVETIAMVMQIVQVVNDHKEEIDKLCGRLSGSDREYMNTEEQLPENDSFDDEPEPEEVVYVKE